jgi:MFS family permease
VPIAVWAIAAVAVGPMLGGLLGEAVGRRLGFLTAGGLALLLAAATLAVRPPSEREGGAGLGGIHPRLVEAGAVAGAVLLVGMAAGDGYENYLGTGLAAAALGLGMAIGARPAWPGAAALAVVLAGLGAWAWVDGGIAAIAGTLALVGIGLGGRLRSVAAEAGPATVSAGLGIGVGAAAASLAVEAGGPPAAGAAVVLCGLALAALPGLARRRRQPA